MPRFFLNVIDGFSSLDSDGTERAVSKIRGAIPGYPCSPTFRASAVCTALTNAAARGAAFHHAEHALWS